METILQTTNLSRQFGEKMAVNNVNMTIHKGDIYGFIGKNGAGKTTFMRLVLGTAFPTKGEIKLFDGEPFDKARRKIGSLIEAPGLYKNCTAYENLKQFSLIYGGTDAEIKEILSLVGLADTGNKKAGKFSLGMRQRLGIAIALLGNPEFLVLDEPVNGLDPAGMKEVRDLILKLNHEKNITILISSHLLDELSKIVTRYGIINDGMLIEEVTAAELNERCQHKLIFTVDDVQKTAAIFAETIPAEQIRIAGNQVILSSHLEEAAELNKRLVQQDVAVNSFWVHAEGLEQYFMKRIGG